MSRKPLSKRLRFQIFDRDKFTCRYCGRQSDTCVLHVDHLIPVSKGGTNDPENLITSCEDCNLGKSDKLIGSSAPSEADRLRIAQEINEQICAVNRAKDAATVRAKRKADLVAFWCDLTERRNADPRTIGTIFSYVLEYGEEVVYPWIERAADICFSDQKMGMYISGIRRSIRAEEEEYA